MTLLGFEHVGMACGDLERTLGFYCGLLGLRLVLRKPQGQGELAFLGAGGGMLEIFAPGPLDRARDLPPQAAGVRHITFAFDAIDPLVARLTAAGVEIHEQPRPAHNTELLRRVAFCRDPDGLLVELVERAPHRLPAQ